MSNKNKSPKLFVANLSSRVSKSELEEKFERYGKILDINLRDGRDRDRFAFIEFDDVRDAEDAFEKLQAYELHGRKIRIEYSHGGRRERNNSAAKENTHCFVCNQKGHWASDCPEGARQVIKKGTCFVCGSTGHRMRHCPKKRDHSRSGSRRSSRSRSRSRSSSRSHRNDRNGGRRRQRSGSRDRSEDRSRRHSHKRRGSDSRENRRRSRSRDSSRKSRSKSSSRDRSQEKRRDKSRSNSRSRSKSE